MEKLRKFIHAILRIISPTYRQTSYLLSETKSLKKSLQKYQDKETKKFDSLKEDIDEQYKKIINEIEHLKSAETQKENNVHLDTQSSAKKNKNKYLPTLEKMLNAYTFDTVLDIGCGAGRQSLFFKENGKNVTSIDYGCSPASLLNKSDDVIIGDFMEYDFNSRQFDAVWCSHVLEHIPNPNLFLRKIHSILNENGVLALSVPPLKHEIVGGHVSFYNAGVLLYNLVLAGFDCNKARVKKYGYNISVILTKSTINVLPELVFDNGDINTIKKYLPENLDYKQRKNDISFNGDIDSVNWE